MGLRRSEALVVFTAVNIRPYVESDLEQLIKVYKSAFAEPPWNEYMKCVSCEVEYGIKESLTVLDYCKKCDEPLNLVEYWSSGDVIKDLDFALSNPNSFVLVAENDNGLLGLSWGYKLPVEKFPFLDGKISSKANYMDEIAVRGDNRIKGIGTLLGNAYIDEVAKQGLSEIVLRTDERNVSSMRLFEKLGFSDIKDECSPRGKVYDPDFSSRIYLRRRI